MVKYIDTMAARKMRTGDSMADRKIGPVSGPERDRLLVKMFGNRFCGCPAGGMHETDSVAVRLGKCTDSPLISGTETGTDPERFGYLTVSCLNRLLAEGRIPDTLTFSITVPEGTEEPVIRSLVRAVKEALSAFRFPVSVGDANLLRGPVRKPVCSVTVTGTKKLKKAQCAEAEYEIIQCGESVGWDTYEMYRDRKELLTLPEHFRKQVRKPEELDLSGAILLGFENGAVRADVPTHGGIFSALWELGERTKLGMEVRLPDMLLSQQTIEACEILDINPYLLGGGGYVLFVTAEPERLLNALWEAGFPAEAIGTLNTGKDRTVQNREETRSLEPYRGEPC